MFFFLYWNSEQFDISRGILRTSSNAFYQRLFEVYNISDQLEVENLDPFVCSSTHIHVIPEWKIIVKAVMKTLRFHMRM